MDDSKGWNNVGKGILKPSSLYDLHGKHKIEWPCTLKLICVHGFDVSGRLLLLQSLVKRSEFQREIKMIREPVHISNIVKTISDDGNIMETPDYNEYIMLLIDHICVLADALKDEYIGCIAIVMEYSFRYYVGLIYRCLAHMNMDVSIGESVSIMLANILKNVREDIILFAITEKNCTNSKVVTGGNKLIHSDPSHFLVEHGATFIMKVPFPNTRDHSKVIPNWVDMLLSRYCLWLQHRRKLNDAHNGDNDNGKLTIQPDHKPSNKQDTSTTMEEDEVMRLSRSMTGFFDEHRMDKAYSYDNESIIIKDQSERLALKYFPNQTENEGSPNYVNSNESILNIFDAKLLHFNSGGSIKPPATKCDTRAYKGYETFAKFILNKPRMSNGRSHRKRKKTINQ